MSESDDDIPDFLKLSQDERKKVWEANPPKPLATGFRTPEQNEFERKRQQAIADSKRLQRCVSKQKRFIRQQGVEAILQDRKAAAEGKQWDVRTARWIDPIEEALKSNEGKKEMVQVITEGKAKRVKKERAPGPTSAFGFRAGTNYDRMMLCLVNHVNEYVDVKVLAKEAYDSDRNIEKHCRRIVTMARKVQEKVIVKNRLAFEIKKEKTENAVSIGLFAK